MQKLILVRHGETQKNIQEVLHKSGDPEGLDDKGKQQINRTAALLKKFAPLHIFSSNERRALESGQIISVIIGATLESVIGFEERNWGDLSGKPWPEIKKILDPMTLDERYEYEPPKGESWKVFEGRLIRELQKILVENKRGNIVIISHGGAIRALIPFLLGVSREESFKYDPDNASLTIFEILGKNEFKLIKINDTSHLPKGLKAAKS